MTTINKLLLSLFCFFAILINAQPPNPGGGGGGVGPGAPQASPIDMYVYILAIAAILMIAYFAKKYKTQKI